MGVVVRRLWAQPGLDLAAILGLTTALALAASIPLYVDAAYNRILQAELADHNDPAGRVGRPPYTFLFRYQGARRGSTSWGAVRPLDAYLSGPAQTDLNLPLQLVVRHFKTDPYRLFAQDQTVYASDKALTWVNIGFVSGIEDQITLVEGSWPGPAVPPAATIRFTGAPAPLEVLASQALALELGLQVGESYFVFIHDAGVDDIRQIPARVAGLWRPTAPQAPFWFYDPAELNNVLLVSEDVFVAQVAPAVDQEVYLGLWYWVMDGSHIRSEDVNPLLRRINLVQQRASTLLTHTTLDVSPVEPLQKYQRSANQLTLLLFAFSLPIFGLSLAFIGLVMGLFVDQQKNEIAIWRSRGATAGQIVSLALLEGLVLGALALIISLPAGQALAGLMGRTRSFLDFSAQTELSIYMTTPALWLSLFAVGLALATQVGLTGVAARNTIIAYKQERARRLRPSWWQRTWLDVLLMLLVAYGAYLLHRQGGLIFLPGQELNQVDLFQNPLLWLLPALCTLALTLFAVRFTPPLMSILAWLAARTSSVSLLLALQQLARSPRFYTMPLLLLSLILSLAIFTASLAQTLDGHLYDQAYYQSGADLKLTDFETSDFANPGGNFGLQSAAPASELSETRLNIFFFPHQDYLAVPGVKAAARLGRYQGSTRLADRTQEVAFIGLDRGDFARVAFWRRDFAAADLGSLMNVLAGVSDGILAPRSFLAENALGLGDRLRVRLALVGGQVDLTMTIAGAFDFFPTWYPDRGPLLVGNLDDLFQQVGGPQPYQVWLKIDPAYEVKQIETDLKKLNKWVQAGPTPAVSIRAEQERPERQGLFGVLSVGFIGTALLTVASFLLYAVFSFRRRFVELGALRAIGLATWQLGAFIFWELTFLALIGASVGIGLGVLVSYVFIPSLQIGDEIVGPVPPFLVEIAWPLVGHLYAWLGIWLGLVLLGLMALLPRLKIAQAVKLGETV